MGEEKKSALVPRLRFPEFREANGWNEKPLGAICDVLNNKRQPISSDQRKTGLFPYYGASGIVDFVDNYLFDERLLLIGEDGAKWGAFEKTAFIVEGKFWVNNHAHVLKPVDVNDVLLENYLVMLDLGPYVAGAAPPKLTLAKLKGIPVHFPTAQPEQQKVADCLYSIDELIAAEAQKLDALKTHKKGLMQRLFPRDGEVVPRLRFPEFLEAGDWSEKPLGEVCNVLQGYGFPEVLQGRREGKYPFCKVSDISRAVAEKGGLLDEATNYVGDDDLLKLRAKPIPKGATIFAKIGEALRLNRRAYVNKDCLIDNNATGLKAIDGVADDYFVHLLSQLIDLNRHCGGAVPSVNKSTLEEIVVIVPDPDEQRKIAESLSFLDNLITAQSQKIFALKTHKKGLMQQLFPVMDEVEA